MSQLDVLKAAVSAGLDERAKLECDACGASTNEMSSDKLVDHALFDHISRAGINVVKHASVFSSLELAEAAGLEPRTEYEVKWRAARG